MDTQQVASKPTTLLIQPDKLSFTQQNRKEKSTIHQQLNDLIFGSIAGMIGKLVEYPFDTIKVRLQTQPLDQPFFSGPWDCFKKTIKQEGFKSLFTGLSSPLIGSMVENAALFVGYRQVQRMIRDFSMTDEERKKMLYLPEDKLPPLSMSQLILAGAASGAIASFVLTPVELIKCKLQVQLGNQTNVQGVRFTGPFHVIRHVMQTHGLPGFYRGFLATLLREAGGGAFWFGAYEYTCAEFIKYRQKRTGEMITKKDLSAPELMLGGALGGMAYNMSLFPVDVIKSQMQTDEQLLVGNCQRSFFQTAKELYTVGGYRAFYRGCGITVARSAPTSAIIFLTYETLSRHFG
ncbi:mitochondrial carrier domain-containing protein [Cokeromyces recurvatus]|uniref:mitochondrial carrier domain-containing protein n=1 Tax=Cokeromyces recurvatus TaxID=90255 RepID=UPI00221F2002|nr:mitochondrial carrier domain-containing protein [Cokeromyces recurvatus]KAI7907399.1 mitochondrial carrier domain-containing protein [Cokeromyces recurvatus]